ncbi:MAG: hypothetical protein SXV54_09870 [Chloroflexota bacterium]|nr:hypothetical protein [Chloroflexota bacterium]
MNEMNLIELLQSPFVQILLGFCLATVFALVLLLSSRGGGENGGGMRLELTLFLPILFILACAVLLALPL